MIAIEKLQHDVNIVRRELKNLRQELMKEKARLKTEIEKINDRLSASILKDYSNESHNKKEEEKKIHSMAPIGFIQSCFSSKNGIPRQPSLCPTARATLTIEKSLFNNPEHSLMGLQDFSHIWVLFVFHKNGEHNTIKAKVHPPRLNGAATGVFSTRSPHRPSPLGLSLIKLEKIEGSTLFLSGVDLLDETPVLDIKPYIPLYDMPQMVTERLNQHEDNSECHSQSIVSSEICISSEPEKNTPDCKVPSYLKELTDHLDVVFTNRAVEDLQNLPSPASHEGHCKDYLNFVNSHLEAKEAIIGVLRNDPRSVYRRQKCSDRLYYFYINNLHVTCWYDSDIAEVLRVKPVQNNKYAGEISTSYADIKIS